MNASSNPSTIELTSSTDNIKRILEANVAIAIESTEQAEADIKENQLDQILNPFYRWVHAKLPQQKMNYTYTAIGTLGFALGFLVTYSAYDPLGKDFGALLATKVSAEDASTFFEVFFGLCAFLPTGALVGVPTQAEVKKYAAYFMSIPQLPISKDRQSARYTAITIANFLSMFSGIPFYNFLATTFEGVPVLDVAIPVADMVVGYIICSGATRGVIDYYFLKTENEETKALRKNLTKKINIAKATIKDMDWRQIEILASMLSTQTHIDSNDNVKEVLTEVFSSVSVDIEQPNNNLTVVVDEKTKIVSIKNTFSLVGALSGGISTYVYFDPGLDTVTSWLSPYNVSNDAANVLKYSGSTFATGTNSLFDAKYGKLGADNIYNGIMSGQWPSAKSVFAHVLAILSSTPSLYLAIIESESALEYLLIFTTFLGATLGRAIAFEMLQDKIFNFCRKKSPEKLRDGILEFIDTLISAVNTMPAELVEALDEQITEMIKKAKAENLPVAEAATAETETKESSLTRSGSTLFAKTAPIDDQLSVSNLVPTKEDVIKVSGITYGYS